MFLISYFYKHNEKFKQQYIICILIWKYYKSTIGILLYSSHFIESINIETYLVTNNHV